MAQVWDSFSSDAVPAVLVLCILLKSGIRL